MRKSVQTSLLRLVTEGLSSSSWVDSLLEVNHGGTISLTLVVNWALLHAEDLHYTESKCRDRVRRTINKDPLITTFYENE